MKTLILTWPLSLNSIVTSTREMFLKLPPWILFLDKVRFKYIIPNILFLTVIQHILEKHSSSAVTFLCLDLIWCSSSKKQKLLLEDTRLNGFTCIYSRYWRDLNISNWKIAFHCNTQDQGPFLHRVRNEKGTSDSASRRICTIQKRQGTNPWNRS